MSTQSCAAWFSGLPEDEVLDALVLEDALELDEALALDEPLVVAEPLVLEDVLVLDAELVEELVASVPVLVEPPVEEVVVGSPLDVARPEDAEVEILAPPVPTSRLSMPVTELQPKRPATGTSTQDAASQRKAPMTAS